MQRSSVIFFTGNGFLAGADGFWSILTPKDDIIDLKNIIFN